MKLILLLSKFVSKMSGLLLLGMMALTCADVIGGLFGFPILGAEELTALMASVLLAFALPSSHLVKAHVGVEIVHMKMKPGLQRLNDRVITFVSMILFALIAWQCFLYAKELRTTGEVSMTLQFPTYLLIFGISFALFILVLNLLMEFLLLFKKETA
jgi:C4-dicarboxylate transporter DctQ subunit